MNEKTFRYQNVHLNYVEGPNNGSKMLLLHGGSGRWQSFLPIIPDLINTLHIYAMDLRGHGKSSRTDTYKLNDYVIDVKTFIENHVQEPAIIFGNSLGGMIALMTAAYHPKLVRAIIVGDSPLTIKSLHSLIQSQREFAHRVIGWLSTNQKKKIYKELDNEYLAASLSVCDPNMLVAMFDEFGSSFAEYSPENLFPRITCPVFIIRGSIENGSLISDSDMNYASKLLKNLSEAKMSQVGHSLMGDSCSLLKAINLFKDKLNSVD